MPFFTDPAVRLKRGLSKASINFPILTLARQKCVNDIRLEDDDDEDGDAASLNDDDVALPVDRLTRSADERGSAGGGAVNVVGNQLSTFALPNLNKYPDGFKAFLYKDLIETSTLVALEQGGEHCSAASTCFMDATCCCFLCLYTEKCTTRLPVQRLQVYHLVQMTGAFVRRRSKRFLRFLLICTVA